ncbi:D-alanine--D-alanine ligase [Endozoicomonas sp. OPT23]|nr:D-alanine--D-alanine ligase [Endozoicomonas sp. OPT23]
MPPLAKASKPVSFFEFWPSGLIYFPVVIQWLWLSIRYRGISLPLNSNPGITLSGMVGESKAEIFSIAKDKACERIAPWCLLSDWDSPENALWQARQLMGSIGLDFPVVAKPDIGCRGAGVQIIRSPEQLSDYVLSFPEQGKIVLQKLVPYEAEAGIFYIRYPGENRGKIFSITLKYPPYIVGDGHSTLQQLIDKDPRSSLLSELYLKRHSHRLNEVIPENQPFRLAFAGSHSRGCIFRDGCEFITEAMEKSFDKVADGLPEFYYGRIDIRFRDIDSLMNGENYHILEINGASSEAGHIWDCRSSLKEVYRVLFYQYRTLFRLGFLNRRRGFRSPSLFSLLASWKKERELVRHYPDTE